MTTHIDVESILKFHLSFVHVRYTRDIFATFSKSFLESQAVKKSNATSEMILPLRALGSKVAPTTICITFLGELKKIVYFMFWLDLHLFLKERMNTKKA